MPRHGPATLGVHGAGDDRTPGAPVVQQCLQRGVLINCTQQTVVRLLPAMTLTDEETDEGLDVLVEVLGSLNVEA